MTRDDVTRLLAFFAEAYPNTRLPADPKVRVDAWCAALGDEPADAIFEAALVLVKADEFHPSPARCIAVMVGRGDTLSGAMSRVRVNRYLEDKRRVIGEAG